MYVIFEGINKNAELPMNMPEAPRFGDRVEVQYPAYDGDYNSEPNARFTTRTFAVVQVKHVVRASRVVNGAVREAITDEVRVTVAEVLP